MDRQLLIAGKSRAAVDIVRLFGMTAVVAVAFFSAYVIKPSTSWLLPRRTLRRVSRDRSGASTYAENRPRLRKTVADIARTGCLLKHRGGPGRWPARQHNYILPLRHSLGRRRYEHDERTRICGECCF
jgi:hypothetical protein